MNLNDLRKYKFAIQDIKDFQRLVLRQWLLAHDIQVTIVPNPENVDKDEIPFGSCEWTEKVLGVNITPNYYPEFLKDHLFRKVWQSNSMPKKKCFIKPSDRYKRFDGQIFEVAKGFGGGEDTRPKPPYWCSEIVEFENEWRYYLANGQIVTSEWYKGHADMPCKAPELGIKWPVGWTGVADFGQIKDGPVALVECQGPFSFGWYNSDYETFAKFIITGYKYMRRITLCDFYEPIIKKKLEEIDIKELFAKFKTEDFSGGPSIPLDYIGWNRDDK